MRSVVERDIAGETGSAISGAVVESLSTKLLGERKAALLRPYLEGQDQPEILEAMLQRYFEETTGTKGRHHAAVLRQALRIYHDGKQDRPESPPADKTG